MNKKELISDIASRTGFTKKDCALFLETFCESVTASLSRGERVKIVNCGLFGVKKVAGRSGKNFFTNGVQPIPEKILPMFVPGDGLKKAVEGLHYDGD